jgi:hypothetical protein
MIITTNITTTITGNIVTAFLMRGRGFLVMVAAGFNQRKACRKYL